MSNGYGYKTAVSPASTGGPVYGGGITYPSAPMGAPAYPSSAASPMTMPMGMGMPSGVPMGMPSGVPMGMPMTAPMTAPMSAPMTAGAATVPTGVPSGSLVTPSGGNIVAVPGVEESYVENILRLNRGKMATFYMTYENNREWNAKVFRGIIEAAGRDHIIISDPSTGMRFLLLTLNLDYVTFEGPINYQYPFQGATITNSTPITVMGGVPVGGAQLTGR